MLTFIDFVFQDADVIIANVPSKGGKSAISSEEDFGLSSSQRSTWRAD